jgi:hypothetical protein
MATVASPQSANPQFGEGLVGELYGKYYQLAKVGQIFVMSTGIAGVTMPIATTTVPTFVLKNPAGSGKNLVMLKAAFGYISGTVIASAWHYSSCLSANTSFTTTGTPSNALVGSGVASISNISVTGTNTTSAATAYRHSGISNGAPITSTTSYYYLTETFEGDFIIPPGQTIFPSADPVQGGTFAMSFVWAEMPV